MKKKWSVNKNNCISTYQQKKKKANLENRKKFKIDFAKYQTKY